MSGRRSTVLALLLLAAPATVVPAQEGKVTRVSKASFARVAAALEQAVADQKMTLVCRANAQLGAAARGVSIKGNQVFMVFRNDFAVRILEAEPPAGFEAPLRIYLYENPDGTATLTYVKPSVLFQPYRHHEVAKVAAELDPIFETMVTKAAAAP